MADRKTETELAQFLEDALPAAGTPIAYGDFAQQIKDSEYPESLQYYRYLKKRGVVRAQVSVTDDGKIVHTIERV